MKVLVTGAGALLGQGIIKALRSSSFVDHVAAVDSSPMAVGLYLADRAHIVPLCRAPNYVERLVELARHEAVDAILCGTDLEVPILARHRAEIEAATGASLIVSGPEAVAIADDKWLTVEFLRKNGFDAPRSALAPDATALAEACGYPLVVKPRIGAGSVGLSRVRTAGELALALEKEGMVVQECLLPDDEEYTVGTLVIDGSCKSVVALKRTLRHGNTHTAISGDYPEVAAHAAAVAEKLPGAFGPVNLQMRLTPRGPVVFEINARFSGTTPLRAELGYNEVEAMLRFVREGAPIPAGALRKAVVLRWATEVIAPIDELESLRKTGTLERPTGEIHGAERRRR